jgi:nitric oxide reductase subunit B
MNTKNLWIVFIAVMVICFTVSGTFGYEIYQQKPPIPEKIVTDSGQQIFDAQEIKEGQSVWQSMGGQEVGTIWGHGSYVAPDWSADWLHREAEFILNELALKADSIPYDKESPEMQSYLKSILQKELRTNTYNDTTKTLIVSDLRAKAIKANTCFGRFSALYFFCLELDCLDYIMLKIRNKTLTHYHSRIKILS